MAKQKWLARRTEGDRVIMARVSRSEIVVRIEKVGNALACAEWGMPKLLGIGPAMDQANLQTKDEDITE